MTMLLMSNALLPLFFFNTEDKLFGGKDWVRFGVGLGVDVGVDGVEPTVGNDKLLARFCSWAAE